LNSGPYACLAGPLLIEPCPQALCFSTKTFTLMCLEIVI
jgi:hypothetical protein